MHIENVTRTTQRGEVIYTFSLNGNDFARLCRVERFGESAEGVNRKLDMGHAEEIAEAMLDPKKLWLDPIIGDLRGQWTFNGLRLTYNGDSYVTVDDGQHRLHAIIALNEAERMQLNFVVVATHGLSYERRLEIFRQQSRRKAIDARLDLAQRNRLGDWENPLDGEAYHLVLQLNSDVSSPLKDKILLEEDLKRPYEGRHRPQGINAKGLVVTLRSLLGGRSPLHVLSPGTRAEVIMTMIRLAADVWPKAWASDRHILTTARGINAVLMLIISSPNFRGVIGDNFGQDSLRKGLSLASTFDWASGKNRNDSVKKIVERLDQSIGRNQRATVRSASASA